MNKLDLRGYKCPMPVLKVRHYLKKIKAGEEINVIADDPLSIIDIPNFCQETKNILVSQKETEGNTFEFIIKKVD